MDVGIINPFLESTLEVTRSMAQLEAILGSPALKTNQTSQGEVTGLIELASSDNRGSLAITFSKDALLLVYQRMLGETLTDLDESTLDLAGEITNMVCGGAKQRLSAKGFEFNLTRPIMLSGFEHEIKHLGSGPVVTMALQLEQGSIYIEVCLNH